MSPLLRSTSILMSTSLIAVLLTTGCNMKRPERVDGQVALNGLPSPNVKGIDDTLSESAKAAEAKGDYKKAAHFYQQLADKEPENITFKLQFAEAARRAEIFKPALDAYDTILTKQPDNMDALEGKGLTLLGKGDFDSAVDALDNVIKKDANRWRSLNALGVIFAGKGMQNEAIDYFTKALEISKNNVRVLNNMGLSLAIQKATKDAIDALQLASSLASKDEPNVKKQIDLNLALVYGIAGDMDMAEKTASAHLSGPALNNNLGLYAHLAKDDMMAKTYLNMALAGSPSFYNRAWSNLASLNSNDDSPKQTTGVTTTYSEPSTSSPEPTPTPKKPTTTVKPLKNTKKTEATPAASPKPAAAPTYEFYAPPTSLNLPQENGDASATPPTPHVTSEINVKP